MELAFTFQGETMRDRVTKTISSWAKCRCTTWTSARTSRLRRVFDRAARALGDADFVLHSVAFAPKAAMANPFLDTQREDFLTAHEISAYSLVALSRAAAAADAGGRQHRRP